MFIKAFTSALLASTALAQTYTSCNPLTQTCDPNPALGGAKQFDFTQEQGDWHVTFKPDRVEYTPDGVSLRVQSQGDNPTLQSDFYLMFGRVEAVIQAAPGVGIVSSFVLQSEDLDEIDLEWLGGDNTQVQTNFFVKGNTDTYDRGQFHPIGNPTGEFHTYVIEWTAEQITWTVNGQVIRVLPSNDYHGFPQSPMNIRMGVWAGGDPTNSPGTIMWAGGPTNYEAGPYPMLIKSVNVEDYSTGDAYVYSDMSGTWQSIVAQNGEVHPVRPAVIPPADGTKFDLVSADQGGKSSTASSAPASSPASAPAPASSSAEASSSASAPASSASAPAKATSSIPAEVSSSASAPAVSSPAPSSTKSIPPAQVLPMPPVEKNTTTAANSSTPVTESAKRTSTVLETVTSCKDDACKSTSVPTVANSTVVSSKLSTVIPVTTVATTTKAAVSTESKSSTPVATISQATGTTSASQANAGIVNQASFGAVAVAAFAMMLI
ncbi:putative glycosidase CRH1 [Yarrowia sp. C11]|nr:putative glycosidase CRH1 [Yarrowia sp. E02]KAG5373400.1 putative glycosidase CRH1 [Yarrowia sp. C11]